MKQVISLSLFVLSVALGACAPVHRCDCCDRSIVVTCPGASAKPSSGEGLDPVEPEVACPPCTLYLTGLQLQGELDPKFTKFVYPFTNATMTVFNANGNALGQATLQPDKQYGGTSLNQALTFTPSVDPKDIKSATIRWVDANTDIVTQANITIKP